MAEQMTAGWGPQRRIPSTSSLRLAHARSDRDEGDVGSMYGQGIRQRHRIASLSDHRVRQLMLKQQRCERPVAPAGVDEQNSGRARHARAC